MSEYPPFKFEWRGAADGGSWVVGWPGLEPRDYRWVSWPKKRNARKIFRKWHAERTYGRIERCPQCHGQGFVRQDPRKP